MDRLATSLAKLIASFMRNNQLFFGDTELDLDKVLEELKKEDSVLAQQFEDWKNEHSSSSSRDYSDYDCGFCGLSSNYGCGSSSDSYRSNSYGCGYTSNYGCGSSDSYHSSYGCGSSHSSSYC